MVQQGHAEEGSHEQEWQEQPEGLEQGEECGGQGQGRASGAGAAAWGQWWLGCEAGWPVWAGMTRAARAKRAAWGS